MPETPNEDPIYGKLLMGKESLTQEEQELRLELIDWCKTKLRQGHRPVPLYAALTIMAHWMYDPKSHGLME